MSTTASRWEWNLKQAVNIISLSKDLKAEMIFAIIDTIMLRVMSIDISISDVTDKIIQKIVVWWASRQNIRKRWNFQELENAWSRKGRRFHYELTVF